MKFGILAATTALSIATLTMGTTAGTAVAAPATSAHGHTHAVWSVDRHHKCTRTSSGTCIRGGEFCPRASYGHSGWDAKGRRYVCKGNHQHPHWEKP
ncbi:MAG TPA: hypothetical protein VH085_10125 [Nocardioides sp.]|jgi:hypothetical protein|nr:hypothetical protein [Nocardioides sp.]